MKERIFINNTGFSSDKYGACELCGKWANSVFIRKAETFYPSKNLNGHEIPAFWCHKSTIFGHEECLSACKK